MATHDMNSELAELREQLHQLELDRAKEQQPVVSPVQASDAGPDDSASTGAVESSKWFEELEGMEAEEVLERIRAAAGDKLGELNQELKDIKPTTLLMIFGLGVVLGRLTS
jgi:hypothetical protein